MSCWIMPSHFGSGILAGARRILLALQRLPLLDVGARACDPVSSLFQSAKRIVRSV